MSMETITESTRITREALEAFCIEAMCKEGVSEANAKIVADVLVTTDMLGVSTHGVGNLIGYLRRVRSGALDGQAQPKVVNEGPSWVLVDGHNGMGMVAAQFAMAQAIEKARTTGVAYAGVRNSCHFGAAGYYALQAARENMVGLAMSNDIPSMTAPGARSHIMGTNPLAVAIPAGQERPIVLDIAMSTVAGCKVYQAVAQGKEIPETWIVDGEGQPTTNGNIFPQSASLLPMAGHKGYGLALMIEAFSALLSGANSRNEVSSWPRFDQIIPTGHGHGFLVVNVGAMQPLDLYQRRTDEMIRDIRQSPKAKGSDRIYLPGEMEWENYAQAQEGGIPLPSNVIENLRELAGQTGLDWEAVVGRSSRKETTS